MCHLHECVRVPRERDDHVSHDRVILRHAPASPSFLSGFSHISVRRVCYDNRNIYFFFYRFSDIIYIYFISCTRNIYISYITHITVFTCVFINKFFFLHQNRICVRSLIRFYIFFFSNFFSTLYCFFFRTTYYCYCFISDTTRENMCGGDDNIRRHRRRRRGVSTPCGRKSHVFGFASSSINNNIGQENITRFS